MNLNFKINYGYPEFLEVFFFNSEVAANFG